jgi:small subunit ribosomal protein S15
MLNTKEKQKVIEKTRLHEKDTGSSAVQIALLSEQINRLSDHLKKNKKDYHSRRGLLKIVADRRAHMRYLEKHDKKAYDTITKKLNLKK